MKKGPLHAFCLAAPRSGEGKTTISLALMGAFVRQGYAVQAFKCGPDYIDPTFLAQATGRAVYNMDTWMMGHEGVRALMTRYAQDADIAVCEGVMGLFDGREAGHLEGSTIDCAKALGLPVVLVCNAKGMASSIVPFVDGFTEHAAKLGVPIIGVIANNVGSVRHTNILATALGKANLPPLLGAFSRHTAWALPERQLGLVPAEEAVKSKDLFEDLATAASNAIDLERLLALSLVHRPNNEENVKEHLALKAPSKPITTKAEPALCKPKRLAIAKDHAFCFYYPANEHALESMGWTLLPFSPLQDTALPKDIDAIYLGGGYPEVFAQTLSANVRMREAIYNFAAAGGEIYAECGGYMYLCTNLVVKKDEKDTSWPMCNVIEATAVMGQKIRSLGYRQIRLADPYSSPLGLSQQVFRGHEFHWSAITLHRKYPPLYTIENQENAQECGVVHGKVRAGYVHLYWGLGAFSEREKEEQTSHQHLDSATPSKGFLVLINGPSSAGKTTLAKALQSLCAEHGYASLHLAIDSFLQGATGSPESVLAGIATTKLPFVQAFHAAIAEAANAGALVIADHVIGENPDWVPELMHRLNDSTRLVCVQVHCAEETLRQREAARSDRAPNWPHAERQAKNIHIPLPEEIVVNTTKTSPTSCAAVVIDRLLKKGCLGCQQDNFNRVMGERPHSPLKSVRFLPSSPF